MQALALAIITILAIGALGAPAHNHSQSEYGIGANGFKDVSKAPNPLNIVLTNDDSWASANIRATYYALRTAGHKVLMVAPARQQSGVGGKIDLPVSTTLVEEGRYGTIEKGAPYSGRNESDPGLRYFDGSPAACSLWALDQEAAEFFDAEANDKHHGIQLQISGPNEGQDLGPFLYTLSGTVGATYTATERGIPAISFSSDSNSRDYRTLDLNNSSDPSILFATQTANFVSELALSSSKRRAMEIRNTSKAQQQRILPLDIGLKVNYPSLNVQGCMKPKWTPARLTGGAVVDRLEIDNTTGLPQWKDDVTKAVNLCTNGNCTMPGETEVVANGNCAASVSMFVSMRNWGNVWLN